jgi:hypothetical protein
MKKEVKVTYLRAMNKIIKITPIYQISKIQIIFRIIIQIILLFFKIKIWEILIRDKPIIVVINSIINISTKIITITIILIVEILIAEHQVSNKHLNIRLNM